jgi:hypothetical protein
MGVEGGALVELTLLEQAALVASQAEPRSYRGLRRHSSLLRQEDTKWYQLA